MSWFARLFGSAPKVETEDQKREVYRMSHNVWEAERQKDSRRTLEDVRVPSGQNPFSVGAMALLQGMGDRFEKGREEAMRRITKKYGLTKEALLALLKEGDTENWEK